MSRLLSCRWVESWPAIAAMWAAVITITVIGSAL